MSSSPAAPGTEWTGEFWSKSIELKLKSTKHFFLDGFDNCLGFEFVGVSFCFQRQQFLSWQISLLCKVGDLAGGGSVAVAVDVGDR